MSDSEPNPKDIRGNSSSREIKKPITIPTDTIPDYPLTPEEKAERARIEARETPSLLAVDKTLHEETITSSGGQSGNLAVAHELAKTTVPETDFENFASAVLQGARELAPADEDINFYDARDFISASESVEDAHLFQQFAQKWKEKFLIDVTDKRVRQNRVQEFKRIIGDLSPTGKSPRPEPRSEREMTELFGVFMHVYDAAYSIPWDADNQPVFNTLTRGAKDVCLGSGDYLQAERVLQLFSEVRDNPDKKFVEQFMDTITKYGSIYGLSEDAVRGFKEKLLPAMRANEPQVAILGKKTNSWGMKKGDFGAADFLCRAYALKVTPSNINELMMITREFATSDFARFEQNRLDAFTLSPHFGILKDFIHDQKPYVHDVIEAMVKYYDTGDAEQLLAVLDKTDYFKGEESRKLLLDRERYDREVEENTKDGYNPDRKIKPIDVLRRLAENTKPVKDTPPETSDPEFNVLLQQLAEDGQNKILLKGTIDYANGKLIEMMQKGEVGIGPNHILAFSWLERKGFEILQGLNYEGQLEAYGQDWFHSILRFQELTWSPGDYDETQFQQFLSELSNAQSPNAAYRLIFQRALEHINKLGDKYKAMGKESRVGALWSGNIAHELIGLTDLRPAGTEYGRRQRAEAMRPEEDRLKGD